MGENEHEGSNDTRVGRRKLIKRAMIAGGVAVWATPLAASARHGFFGGTSAQVTADQLRADALRRAAELRARSGPGGGVTVQQTSPCTGYPATSCVTFDCGQAPVVCGQGAGGFVCFCDVDSNGNCVCVNDAFCSQLPSCSQGCPPGWFCIPTSCCGVPKCAPPCGTAASAQAGIASTAGAGGKISGR